MQTTTSTMPKPKGSLFTAATVKAALRDAGGNKVYDLSDSQIKGLQIRVRAATATWSVRCSMDGKQTRYVLGPVVAGDEDRDGGLCLKTARSRAFRVKEMHAAHLPVHRHLQAWASGVTIERLDREAPVVAAPPPSWEYTDAVARFVAWNKEYRRGETKGDYEQKLLVPEMVKAFEGRAVVSMTKNEVMSAVAEIAKRAHPMSCGVRRVASRFLNWCAEPERQAETSVVHGVMAGTRDLDPPLQEVGDPTAPIDDDEEAGDAPPEVELGRALAIARAGVLPERTSLGLLLLLGSVQRRRAVAGAAAPRFRCYAEAEGEHVWFVPPHFRKSGRKRGRRSHLVPIVGWAAEAVDRLDRLVPDGGNPFFFPIVRARRGALPSDGPPRHRDVAFMNRALEAMPGVGFSTHGGRYAFASYGERDLSFARGEGKVVLDHAEGVESDDVTGQFYSSDPGIARKREMMRRWTSWLDDWAATAIARDPLLRDKAYLREMLFRGRYRGKDADERLARHIAYAERRGVDPWMLPDDEDE